MMCTPFETMTDEVLIYRVNIAIGQGRSRGHMFDQFQSERLWVTQERLAKIWKKLGGVLKPYYRGEP